MNEEQAAELAKDIADGFGDACLYMVKVLGSILLFGFTMVLLCFFFSPTVPNDVLRAAELVEGNPALQTTWDEMREDDKITGYEIQIITSKAAELVRNK